jgi:hypothetical protein
MELLMDLFIETSMEMSMEMPIDLVMEMSKDLFRENLFLHGLGPHKALIVKNFQLRTIRALQHQQCRAAARCPC